MPHLLYNKFVQLAYIRHYSLFIQTILNFYTFLTRTGSVTHILLKAHHIAHVNIYMTFLDNFRHFFIHPFSVLNIFYIRENIHLYPFLFIIFVITSDLLLIF